eukprot:2669605-Rhodomonas_salina.2
MGEERAGERRREKEREGESRERAGESRREKEREAERRREKERAEREQREETRRGAPQAAHPSALNPDHSSPTAQRPHAPIRTLVTLSRTPTAGNVCAHLGPSRAHPSQGVCTHTPHPLLPTLCTVSYTRAHSPLYPDAHALYWLRCAGVHAAAHGKTSGCCTRAETSGY